MRLTHILFVLTLSILSLRAYADAMDSALKEVGLTKADVQFSDADIASMAPTELISPLFRQLRSDPLRIPLWSKLWREGMLKESNDPVEVVSRALGPIGFGIRRHLYGNPLVAEEKKALGGLVNAIKAVHGGRLSAAQVADLQKRVVVLPKDLQESLAFLIYAQLKAVEAQKKAFSKFSSKDLKAAFKERTQPLRPEMADDYEGVGPYTRQLISGADLNSLTVGGLDLVYAIGKLRKKLSEASFDTTFKWSTPLGQIIIGNAGNSLYKADQKYFLIVDVSGNDVYWSGAGATPEFPVSVVIDIKGADKYEATVAKHNSKEVVPVFGAGVFGYGILVDMSGNDVYFADRHALGRGDFGLGLLWDLQGDDLYDCYGQCEGSAEFGVGILADGTGTDKYSTVTQAQGFGGPLGTGLLLDTGKENDEYSANPAQVDFPSLVDKKFNVSLVQGFAYGFRADVIDGFSLAGGFGALVDGGGNNKFSAGFFAQGFSYWYGVGLLSVGAGNDVYEAGKYAQGAGAHFGVGILDDLGGNDNYSVQQELGLGHGHDFSIGFFIDEGGDDIYNAPNFALGCASAQGIGIFWDQGGSDKYSSKEKEILGCVSLRVPYPSTRYISKGLGVFLDTGNQGAKNLFETPLHKGRLSSNKWIFTPSGLPADINPEVVKRLYGTAIVE